MNYPFKWHCGHIYCFAAFCLSSPMAYSPPFLACFPVTLPIHLLYFPPMFPTAFVSTQPGERRESISVPGLSVGTGPSELQWMLGRSSVVRVSSYIWSCQLTCQMACRHSSEMCDALGSRLGVCYLCHQITLCATVIFLS